MALIEYKTVPAQSNANTEFSEWFRGQAVHSSGLAATLGMMGTTQSDVGSWLQSGQKPIHEPKALVFKGENGKDHWMTVVIEADEALWVPADKLTGFSVVTQQNSTSGHALYTNKIGLKFKNQAGLEHLWLGLRGIRLDTIAEWTIKFDFSEKDLQDLQGFYVSGFVVEVSSKGGSGTRQSQVTVGHLKLYYDNGPENTRWVVGAMRPPEKMEGEGSIKFN